jgi:DNA-binding response OmpR family regulator
MNNPKTRILVVDDDSKLTGQMRRSLEETGEFQVLEENRASHALIAARGFLPDLFIVDVVMPGKEGGDLAYELRQIPRFKHTPVVFLTGRAATTAEINEHHGYIGGERFLHKPVGFQELVDCIHEELEKARLHPAEHKPAEVASPPFAY